MMFPFVCCWCPLLLLNRGHSRDELGSLWHTEAFPVSSRLLCLFWDCGGRKLLPKRHPPLLHREGVIDFSDVNLCLSMGHLNVKTRMDLLCKHFTRSVFVCSCWSWGDFRRDGTMEQKVSVVLSRLYEDNKCFCLGCWSSHAQSDRLVSTHSWHTITHTIYHRLSWDGKWLSMMCLVPAF